MSLEILEFKDAHIPAAVKLWKRTPGLGLSEADEPKNLRKFLARNPGLSLVAMDTLGLVGTVMAGHDGRRGFLYHLAVDGAYQRQGLGTKLVERALASLRTEGITQVRVFVKADNKTGKTFWSKTRWTERTDLALFGTGPEAH